MRVMGIQHLEWWGRIPILTLGIRQPGVTMRLLILGCGYLGERLAHAWLASGNPVFAATRSSARAEKLRQFGIDPIICDITNPKTLHSFPPVAVVVWAVGWDRSTNLSMRAVYVEGLGHALAAVPQHPRFVYISSTGVYGQTD